MQLHEVGEVLQVAGATNANNRLKEGWKLIAVVPNMSKASGPGGSAATPGVFYVLGKPVALGDIDSVSNEA